MATIKKNEFVEVEYTGKIKETDDVFDTTDEAVAKKSSIYSERMMYGPVVVCVGEKQLLAALDRQLEGKETGKSYQIELKPEEAFGKKDAKLLKMIPSRIFREQGIVPIPGLQVSIDGTLGTIRTVAGGRIIVDFNHPLSGKGIAYDVKLKRLVTDDREKVKEYVRLQLSAKDVDVEIDDNTAKIKIKGLNEELPEAIKEQFSKKISELIHSVKKAEFIAEKQESVTSKEEQKNK